MGCIHSAYASGGDENHSGIRILIDAYMRVAKALLVEIILELMKHLGDVGGLHIIISKH